MRTTINRFGIATSLSKERDYLISTVESPDNSGRYETVVKPLGFGATPIVVVTRLNSKEATCAHISAFRMVYSTNREDWNRTSLESFGTDELITFVDESLGGYSPKSLQDQYCALLLEVGGVTMKDEKKGIFDGLKRLFGK